MLAGAGIDPHADACASRSTAATSTAATTSSRTCSGEKVQLFGASAQVAIHKGMPVRSSVDYKLYKYNGERVSRLFTPEKYPGGAGVARAGRVHGAGPDAQGSGEDRLDQRSRSGTAGDLNVRVKIDRIRLRLDLSYRDLAFILHSPAEPAAVLGLPVGLHDSSRTTSRRSASTSNWDDWLTLGADRRHREAGDADLAEGHPGRRPTRRGRRPRSSATTTSTRSSRSCRRARRRSRSSR